MIKWPQIERIRAIAFTFMHGLKKIYKVLFLIIEIPRDALLHTSIFHLASNSQMFYPFGACDVTFTVWQIPYQFAESEECGSTDYKYALLNNVCKNITCFREEAFRQSST